MRYRNGIGYDVHRLVEGRPLVLGGIVIPFEKGLDGHSDADVLSHAIADAILGALGEPDIGFWFPPTDETIEGISSMKILKKAQDLVEGKRAFIENIDSTVIAEAPKILPYADQMRRKISSVLSLPAEDIGIKATTNEEMGFVGRGEGIAVIAIATIAFPDVEDERR
ncbi:MAG: 2-C-methyl-D-erythritol 2,4-cyclodiphosphate synthase [Verrucomicrobiales bacterium]|nr:2-C-methyl-D-erythritol 2,4-cyclodiphosphate synthase [Verrucomicrobiales bacterium]